MIIEIDTDVFFDTDKSWYAQTADCIARGMAVMQNPPDTAGHQSCAGGYERLVWGVWNVTTATGSFALRVDRSYAYGPESPAFLSKEFQDDVTVTVL